MISTCARVSNIFQRFQWFASVSNSMTAISASNNFNQVYSQLHQCLASEERLSATAHAWGQYSEEESTDYVTACHACLLEVFFLSQVCGAAFVLFVQQKSGSVRSRIFTNTQHRSNKQKKKRKAKNAQKIARDDRAHSEY